MKDFPFTTVFFRQRSSTGSSCRAFLQRCTYYLTESSMPHNRPATSQSGWRAQLRSRGLHNTIFLSSYIRFKRQQRFSEFAAAPFRTKATDSLYGESVCGVAEISCSTATWENLLIEIYGYFFPLRPRQPLPKRDLRSRVNLFFNNSVFNDNRIKREAISRQSRNSASPVILQSRASQTPRR